MFKWKASEGKLLNEKRYEAGTQKGDFLFEEDTPREDKIQFINERTNGMLDYILDLAKKWQKDKDALPKEHWGGVKTVSKKAWIKRNDTKKALSYDYDIGSIRVSGLPSRRIFNLEDRNYYEKKDDFIDEAFHNILMDCLGEEKKYFRSHDEYQVLADKVQSEFEHNRYSSFGLTIVQGSQGLWISDGSKDWDKNKRRLTLAELKKLVELNDKLKEFEQLLAKEENDIDYEHPKGDMPDKKKLGYIYDR